MKRLLLFLILICILILIRPTWSGFARCGPVCSSHGVHWEKLRCLGYEHLTDSFEIYCVGLAVGEPQCYGIPYFSESNGDDVIDCDYPCNDEAVKEVCETQLQFIDRGTPISCSGLIERCGW